VLTVPEIIEVLVSFSSENNWEQFDGECIDHRDGKDWGFLMISSESDGSVKTVNYHMRFSGQVFSHITTCKSLRVTGPTLEYNLNPAI
jgi:hypothetical protein